MSAKILKMPSNERRYVWRGHEYILIDVRDRAGNLIRCMYATKGAYGQPVWQPCGESVSLDTIHPFRKEEPAT